MLVSNCRIFSSITLLYNSESWDELLLVPRRRISSRYAKRALLFNLMFILQMRCFYYRTRNTVSTIPVLCSTMYWVQSGISLQSVLCALDFVKKITLFCRRYYSRNMNVCQLLRDTISLLILFTSIEFLYII